MRRVGLVGRESPELHEPTEVIDPQQVAQLELAFEALEPPGEAVGLVLGPVEDGHAPALSLGMVERRRRAGNGCAVEQVRVRRDVTRVPRDVERDVTDEADTTVVRVVA